MEFFKFRKLFKMVIVTKCLKLDPDPHEKRSLIQIRWIRIWIR